MNLEDNIVQIHHYQGTDTIGLSTREYSLYVQSPEKYAAKMYELTVSEYREWVEHTGGIQCSAQTKLGKRCRNYMNVTPMHLDAKMWKTLQGGCCGVHGGPRAKELILKEED